MKTKVNVLVRPRTISWKRMASLFFFVIMLGFNALAQVTEKISMLDNSDSAKAAAPSTYNSDFWGYVFAVLGILGGIAIAWILAVGATKVKPKQHHHHPHHSVKHRR